MPVASHTNEYDKYAGTPRVSTKRNICTMLSSFRRQHYSMWQFAMASGDERGGPALQGDVARDSVCRIREVAAAGGLHTLCPVWITRGRAGYCTRLTKARSPPGASRNFSVAVVPLAQEMHNTQPPPPRTHNKDSQTRKHEHTHR